MSNWHVYDIASGRLLQQLVDSLGPLDDIQPGQLFVTGHYDTFTQYVVEGQVITRPAFPINITANNVPIIVTPFRLDNVPNHTIVTYDDNTTVDTGTDGFFELTSITAGTVPVTLTLFPYVSRTIDAIFTP